MQIFLKRESTYAFLYYTISFYKCRDIGRWATTREVLRRQVRQLRRQSDVNHRLFNAAELLPARSRRIFPSRFTTCKSPFPFSAQCYLSTGATIQSIINRKSWLILINSVAAYTQNKCSVHRNVCCNTYARIIKHLFLLVYNIYIYIVFWNLDKAQFVLPLHRGYFIFNIVHQNRARFNKEECSRYLSSLLIFYDKYVYCT